MFIWGMCNVGQCPYFNMENKKNYDVVIVGAGPAGLSTALECSKAGLTVLLIEESGLTETEKSWVTFPNAINDYPLIKEAITNTVNRLRFYGAKESFDSGPTPIKGYLIEQSVMNRAYKAEINKFKNCRISDKTLYQEAKRKNGCVEVRTSQGMFTGKIIVDASGSYSVVANDLMVPNKRFWLFMCYFLRIHKKDALSDYGCVVYSHGGAKAKSRGIAGALYPNSKDYFDIGVANYLESGQDTGKMRMELREQAVNLWNFFQKQRLIKEEVKIDFSKEFYGGIRVTPRETIYGDNIIIVGDAAGQGSPITGEGLRTGLYYGEIAAKAIIKAFKKNDFSQDSLKQYSDLSKKNPLFGYDYGLIIQKLIRNNLATPPFKKFQKLCNSNNRHWRKYGLTLIRTLIRNDSISLKSAIKLLIKFYLS